MLTGKTRIPIKTANPEAAFKQLQGKAFRVDGKHKDSFSSQIDQEQSDVESLEVKDSLRVGAALGANMQAIDSTTPNQNQQLAEHLQAKERELAEAMANHQVSVWNWQQEVAKQQARFDQRRETLNQQEENLRGLQFELFQLQNDLIESQLATRSIVNSMDMPGYETAAAEALKLELNQRFDHMMVTWREFAQQMETLVQEIDRTSS